MSDDDIPIKTRAVSRAYRENWERIFGEMCEIDEGGRVGSKSEPAFTIENDWQAWPEGEPLRYNACTEPCDMWTGPCACGAFHRDGK